MEEQALRTFIRTKLQDGRLPLSSIPRVRGGSGRGETCAACETTITSDQLTVEGIVVAASGSIPIILHVKCFEVLNQERRALVSRR